jgi:hypothetical protein
MKHVKSRQELNENQKKTNLTNVNKSYEFLDDAYVTTSDFFYDLFIGGYIKIEDILKNKEDIDEVKNAIKIIKKFKNDAEDNDILNID